MAAWVHWRQGSRTTRCLSSVPRWPRAPRRHTDWWYKALHEWCRSKVVLKISSPLSDFVLLHHIWLVGWYDLPAAGKEREKIPALIQSSNSTAVGGLPASWMAKWKFTRDINWVNVRLLEWLPTTHEDKIHTISTNRMSSDQLDIRHKSHHWILTFNGRRHFSYFTDKEIEIQRG